jgi:hypothetical protein
MGRRTAMADLQQVQAEMQRAFEEAGVSDFDLSYLTQELIDEGEREAREPDEAISAAVGEGEAAPESNRLWNVWFSGGPGSRVYGYLLSGGTCAGSWYVSYIWNQRQLLYKCSNRNSYVWQVS